MIRFYFLLTLLVLASCDDATHLHHRSKRSADDFLPGFQLLKDALGWMTFRKNGVLQTPADLMPLFFEPHLKPKYRQSKYYQTFLIAFEQAVLPRLTLQENDPCDPAYTSKYKDPDNSSVTWHYQKMFTMEIYKTRSISGAKFCDYRQGLICKTASKKCGCPEGSALQPIESGSSVKRCLLQEKEICALIDLDHGNDLRHSVLGRNLYHLIFNLEKPPGCKAGTLCRFKEGVEPRFPRCYDVNGGPWTPPRAKRSARGLLNYSVTVTTTYIWSAPIGAECVLGLIADPGSCDTPKWSDRLGTFGGYICYNFGPLRSKKSSPAALEPKTGFCTTKFATYGIADWESYLDYRPYFHPLFIPYVDPTTVPLRDKDLTNFYTKYYNEFYGRFSGTYGILENEEGGRCSVSKTETLEKIWKYFQSLGEDPPPGKDFVAGATKAELESNLQSVVDLTSDSGKANRKKVCLVYEKGVGGTSYKCVADGSPDSAGNDGTCQKPGNLKMAEFTAKFEAFCDRIGDIEDHLNEKEKDEYDAKIFRENPGPPCTPGGCPEEYVCYEEYRQDQDRIDYLYYCDFDHPREPYRACHDTVYVDKYNRYGNCEKKHLNERAFEEFEKMVEQSSLGRGVACRFELEQDIREWLRNRRLRDEVNKYKMLAKLEEERTLGGGSGFCDRTRLLECAKEGGCQCVEGTEPRKVIVGGKAYTSDYCYLAQGSCKKNVTELMPLTNAEKERIPSHYGYGVEGEDCAKNVCVFLGGDGEQCTTENTGKTGHDLDPDATERPTRTTTESHTAGGPGWRHVGGAGDLRGSKMVTGFGLASSLAFMMMISFIEI